MMLPISTYSLMAQLNDMLAKLRSATIRVMYDTHYVTHTLQITDMLYDACHAYCI